MKTLTIVVTLILLLGACGGATLRPGRVVSADFPVVTHSLRQLWPGAADILLAAGYPVRGDWYADTYLLEDGGPLSITASSSSFTPVLVVIDSAGHVLAADDSHDGRNDAFVALREVPEGARLVVFSLDDLRGDYTLDCSPLTQDELARDASTPFLLPGLNRGVIPPHRTYAEMTRALGGFFGDWVYAGDFQTARVHPFSITEEGLVTLEVTDAAFDAVMVLATSDPGSYGYVTYQDDTYEMLPGIASFLQPGSYVAVVMGYSEGEGGPYTLQYDFLPTADLTVDVVDAPEPGVEVRGEISPGRNLAISLWRELAEGSFTESSLEPSDPTGAFAFEVTEPDVYVIDAAADFDVCLTLLRNAPEGRVFTGYNDDGGADLGTDSRLSVFLPAGGYTALVAPYYPADAGSVFLTWTASGTRIPVLQTHRSQEVHVSPSEPAAYLQFEVMPTQTYVITAEDDVLDPTIEVFLPDGTSLFDDDGGGDLNSMLTLYPTDRQTGTCILKVSGYWSDEEGDITVRLEAASLQ